MSCLVGVLVEVGYGNRGRVEWETGEQVQSRSELNCHADRGRVGWETGEQVQSLSVAWRSNGQLD